MNTSKKFNLALDNLNESDTLPKSPLLKKSALKQPKFKKEPSVVPPE
jgi:hypothetical protein